MYKSSKSCRLCNSKNIEVLLKLKPMPLGEVYFRKKINAEKVKKYPFSLGLCQSCKNVQTMEVVKSRMLWTNYTYFSGQTKSILEHFEKFSRKVITRFKLNKNDLVFDIGSNDGSLLKFFKSKKIQVLGIDPAENLVRFSNNQNIKTVKGFFNFETSKKILKRNNKPKIITAFNVFAHTEDLRGMLKGIKNLLSDDGIFIFEVQYLGDIYKKKILGTFFHEHMYHYSLFTLKKLFNSFNMNLFDVDKVNIQKGSIIGYVSKKRFPEKEKIKKMIKIEVNNKFNSKFKLKELKRFIDNQKKKSDKIFKKFKKISIYGSARSGPVLGENLCRPEKFQNIFDNHKMKINKYSGYRGLKVIPTKYIKKLKPDLCVILAYLHSKKIIRNNIKYLKDGGNFLIVYPNVKLINFKNYKKHV